MEKKRYLNCITIALALGSVSGLAQACNTEPYIGSVCTFAMDWCPMGYVKADGRAMTIQQNQALFGLLGFQYGGNNRDQFNIPDLRGRSVVGSGQGTGLPVTVNIAQKIGQQTLVLSAAQTPVQPHVHPATLAPSYGATQINIPAVQGSLDVKASLPVDPATGNVVGETVNLTSGASGYLAGMKGSTGVDTVTFNGPYSTSKPGNDKAKLEADVTVTGTASTAAATATAQTMTGGTVTVGMNNIVNPTEPVSTQSPAMGMSVCIAVQGLYPNRP